MNMNQVVNMIVRVVMRRAINSGINAGINAFSGAGRKKPQRNVSGVDDYGNVVEGGGNRQSRDEQPHQQQAGENTRRARQMAKVTRRVTKF